MTNECANCPYIDSIHREMKEHKKLIDRNGDAIVDLKGTTERNEERFNTIINTIREIKFSLDTLTDKLDKVNIDTVLNTQKLRIKFDLNWTTITPILIAILTFIKMLLDAFA